MLQRFVRCIANAVCGRSQLPFLVPIAVMSIAPETSIPTRRIPVAILVLAWVAGIAASLVGMLNLIAEWDPNLAMIQFIVLVVAPIIWMIGQKPSRPASDEMPVETSDRYAYVAAVLVAVTSFGMCFAVGREMVDLPPAYHDEYSYLFQAKTLLSGAFSKPGHATHPELFDQMHVLNEGRMASRYYPGTGLWLAPWVALGHPSWGHWLASSLASVFVFWTGYELGRLRVALVSGFACALSPGIAVFANLLLAHQPTMLGLGIFIHAFVKWQRTTSPGGLFVAGCGLSFAMLCRPATAAGVALPFGIAFLSWLLFARNAGKTVAWQQKVRSLMALSFPLVAGWAVMLAYHHDVTGSWTTSPYQLYTDLYSPRHVFGFNNGVRGELKQGPKVIAAYDRWANNLTPELAAVNVRDRLLTSWLWTFDISAFLMAAVVVAGTAGRWNARWISVIFGILSLHAIHIPYWYVGIMGWHYVFESATLWCLVLGLATDLLVRDWRMTGRWLMPVWWILYLAISLAGAYFPIGLAGVSKSTPPRVYKAIGSVRQPRKHYAEFDQWIQTTVTQRPALVLIVIDPDDQHIDYVVNSPGLHGDILRGRYRIGITDVTAISQGFPDRHIYLCDPKKRSIRSLK